MQLHHVLAGVALSAAAVPIGAAAAAAVANFGATNWLAVPASLLRSIQGEVFLYTSVGGTLGAPLVGVVVETWAREDQRSAVIQVALSLLAAAALFAGVSGLMSYALLRGEPTTAATVLLEAHLTLAVVTYALASVGALCAALLRHPLDAAAVAVGAVLIASSAILIAGGAVELVPAAWLTPALTANPVVAVTAAAHIDIARSEVVYQTSALAHIRADYPTWGAACGWYLLIAVLCLASTRFAPELHGALRAR